MDAQKVDMFIMSNNKFFDSFQLHAIKDQLINLPEEKWVRIQVLQFKDPTTTLIVSILAGSLGIDRFLIGDVGLGIGKLITCGGLSIWAIVDWFLIQAATKEKNMQTLQEALLY
ncbi:MAG: TM2 domain-containing protein [Dysgonamonadaceae bacterium]|jgi:TM2 domain-containing membrane protein YozV|nr:TM2 domain-containing protein [Dysgonamonadaceae bacterium]